MTLAEFEQRYPEYAFDFSQRLRDQSRFYKDDPHLADLPLELIPINQDRAHNTPGPGRAPPRNQCRTHFQCAICKRLLRNDQYVAAPSWREQNRLYPYCRTCRSANTRRYTTTDTAQKRELRRKELSYEIGRIITPQCVYCGFDKHPAAIELHHVDKTEKDHQIAILMAAFTKGRKRKYAEKIRMEADKCVPLCANCHRLIHYGVMELEIRYPTTKWTVDDLMTIADILWERYGEGDSS